MDDLYYKQKYLKYKFKYLELKKNYEGGASLLAAAAKSAAKSMGKSAASQGSEMIINKAESLCKETAGKVLDKAKKIHDEAILHCNKEKQCIDGADKAFAMAKDLHTKITGKTDDKSCTKIAAKAREEAKKGLAKLK
jgi:hypothetical protein